MRIQPWNVVFLIGFIVYVCIRGVFKQRTKSNDLDIMAGTNPARVLGLPER